MIEWPTYLLFLGASIALILVPGPAQALVVGRTVSGGIRAGALTAIGLNIGTMVHATAAGLGLSAILATSALAFSVVKYAGAAYLLYLGIQLLRSKAIEGVAASPVGGHSGPVLGQAVLVGILNPKVALFFLAFLPQFVDPASGAVIIQFLILGLTIAVLDTLYELTIACVVGRLGGRLLRGSGLRSAVDKFAGGILLLLAVRLAAQER